MPVSFFGRAGHPARRVHGDGLLCEPRDEGSDRGYRVLYIGLYESSGMLGLYRWLLCCHGVLSWFFSGVYRSYKGSEDPTIKHLDVG